MQPNMYLSYYLETNIHMSEGVQCLKKKCSSHKIKWKIRLITDVRYNFVTYRANSWKFIRPSPSRSASSIMERTSWSVRGSPKLFIVSLQRRVEKKVNKESNLDSFFFLLTRDLKVKFSFFL